MRTLAVIGITLAVGLAGCGGSSGGGTDGARDALLKQTLPGADGAEMTPTKVTCKAGSDDTSECKVTYPDKQVQDCTVSGDDASRDISCTLDPDSLANAAQERGTTAAKQWLGQWKTTFGVLDMTAADGRISGSYEACNGKLEGQAAAELLVGTWTEDEACPNRDPKAPNSGTFSFEITADRKAFNGSWSYENAEVNPSNTKWDGTLILAGP